MKALAYTMWRVSKCDFFKFLVIIKIKYKI
jgi:hypothetical protein